MSIEMKSAAAWWLFIVVLFHVIFVPIVSFCSTTESNEGVATFVYGNRRSVVPGLKKGWGFSAVIEFDGKRILFNTGGVEDILQDNFEVLGISPKDLDAIVISHEHWEMYEGIYFLLEENPDLPVYTTDIVNYILSKKYPEWARNLISVEKHLFYTKNIIFQNLKSGPRHGSPSGLYEIHIILKTEKGLVIFTGCGHPQLSNIVARSKKLTDVDTVNLLAGGTRLLKPLTHIVIDDSDEDFYIPQFNYYLDEYYYKLADELKEMGVQYVMPTHCTLEPAESIFRGKFGEKYIEHKLGMKLKLPIR